jgi:hypothetical protein
LKALGLKTVALRSKKGQGYEDITRLFDTNRRKLFPVQGFKYSNNFKPLQFQRYVRRNVKSLGVKNIFSIRTVVFDCACLMCVLLSGSPAILKRCDTTTSTK